MPATRVRVPFCGLPCSDLTLEEASGGAARVSGGCAAGREALAAAATDDPRATPRVAGRAASLEEAIDAAAALLDRARSPFIYGLSRSPVGAAREAARLARTLGGAIDIEGSAGLDAEVEAMAAHGLCAATFGEVATRADVVLLWRCDPRAEHPALLPPAASVILVPPRAERPGGSDRTEGVGDRTLPVPAGADLEVLLALRAAARDDQMPAGRAGPVPAEAIWDAAKSLRKARYAAIFWDQEAVAGPDGLAIASALMLLTRDLNTGGRAVARPLGAGGNVAGAMSALLAVGGSPRALGFHGGAARSATETFSAAAMIEGGGSDALVLVGARRLPAPGAQRPRVVVGSSPSHAAAGADVFLPAAAIGLDGGGLFLRADGIPVPVRPAVATGRWQEEAILAALRARVAGIAR
jgi:formylmethanofuran dehydrogenase subunit B